MSLWLIILINIYILSSLQIFDLDACLTMVDLGGCFFDGQQGHLHINSRGKVIIGRFLKFAGHVYHYKSLPRKIFDLIWKNKMATMAVSSSVIKEFCTF